MNVDSTDVYGHSFFFFFGLECLLCDDICLMKRFQLLLATLNLLNPYVVYSALLGHIPCRSRGLHPGSKHRHIQLLHQVVIPSPLQNPLLTYTYLHSLLSLFLYSPLFDNANWINKQREKPKQSWNVILRAF